MSAFYVDIRKLEVKALFQKAKSLFGSPRLDVASRFEVLREAVHGTMSDFLVVREKSTGDVLGLKILDPEKTKAFEGRFRTGRKPSEAEITRKIDHPRVVKVHEHGLTSDGRQFILMDYVEGTGLNSLILQRDTALNRRCLPLIAQMAESLAAVHEAGFIHRDICPRNYLCDKELESIILIDFGLSLPATKEFMAPGNRTGTPLYMAPEILRRRATDHRVDLFALGVTMYQMCAFELPWPGSDTTGKKAVQHDTRPPVPLLEVCPTLNPDLAELVMRCLSVEPADRPQTAAEIQQKVRQIRSESAV
jgi:serine/threonine protein kinase